MNVSIDDLAKTALLADVPPEVLELIQAESTPLELMPGDVLLSPQCKNEHIYLLLSGTLGLHFGSVDSPEASVLQPGVSVGEMSLFNHSSPMAYIVAREHCRVFPVHRDLIYHLVANANPIVRNLLRITSQWLKNDIQYILKDSVQKR